MSTNEILALSVKRGQRIAELESKLESTLAENALLRSALEKFAEASDMIDRHARTLEIRMDDRVIVHTREGADCSIGLTVDDCRKAREALSTSNSKASELLRDRERMDWLEGELERERTRRGVSLFRRNKPITRAAIDSAMAVKEGE